MSATLIIKGLATAGCEDDTIEVFGDKADKTLCLAIKGMGDDWSQTWLTIDEVDDLLALIQAARPGGRGWYVQ